MVSKKRINPDRTTTWIMDEAMAEAVDMIGEHFDLSTIPDAEVQALADDIRETLAKLQELDPAEREAAAFDDNL